MIDHDREVPLSLSVADLINPDPPQPVQQIDVAARLVSDPLKDPADRPPRDAHQLRHSGLRATARQPRDLILKATREPRVMTGPRDRSHDHVMPATVDPRRVRLKETERAPQVQRPPRPTALTIVIPRAASPADPATTPLPETRPDRDDHLPLAADPHVLHHRPLQTKQPGPYPDSAHVASPPRESSLRTAGNPRQRAACAPSSAGHHAHGNVRSAVFGVILPFILESPAGTVGGVTGLVVVGRGLRVRASRVR